MYWIVLADTNLYRIYSYEHSGKNSSALTLLKEVSHPESKNSSRELMTDRPGHYSTPNKSGGSYSGHADPKEDEIMQFLHQLAEQFENGRVNNQYEKIILIALPHVSGILLKQVNKNVKQRIINNFKKDYIHLKENELKQFIHDNWRELSGI